MGSTGHSTGPQLHIDVVQNGKQVDPATYLKINPDILPGSPGCQLKNRQGRSDQADYSRTRGNPDCRGSRALDPRRCGDTMLRDLPIYIPGIMRRSLSLEGYCT